MQPKILNTTKSKTQNTGRDTPKKQLSPAPVRVNNVKAKLIRPNGWIEIEFKTQGNKLSGHIILPTDINGVFHYGDFTKKLVGGKKESICVTLPDSSFEKLEHINN